jgi:integrase
MTGAGQPAAPNRTPAKRKARQLAKYLRAERPDYAYLKEVFRHLRDELGVQVSTSPTKLPYVPTEAEIRRYYQTVWTARRTGDIVLIKTLLYTGVRVAELVAIRISEVNLDTCRIRITHGKGGKDRYVPFPTSFKETLALHINAAQDKGAMFLFESSWKSPTPPAGSAPCSPATLPKPAWNTPCHPTAYATSCSPGSRPKASTTPSSSPTPAPTAAPHSRSTPRSP